MKIFIYYNTIKYLKLKQIYFKVFYSLIKYLPGRTAFRYSSLESRKIINLSFKFYQYNPISFHNGLFTFLSKTKLFNDLIDWNFNKFGKLWTYHLNYFDFINQENIDINKGIHLINEYIRFLKKLRYGMEPYPISLRTINWIKFYTRNRAQLINNQQFDIQKFNKTLLCQLRVLRRNIEYHLMGNHILENGFSLLFGAYYFHDSKLYKKAYKILRNELEEQTLSDGAHIELSPMYHQIILFRLLDCYNLVFHNDAFNKDLLSFFKSKAELMLGFLKAITFNNGNVPHVNDSADGIAPTSKEHFEYSTMLGLKPKLVTLKESGYRLYERNNYELFVDVGNVGLSYQPGHSHNDIFNFLLNIDNKPVIVDTGTSTYEKHSQRLKERSTESHNTVKIDNIEQNEIWGKFRMGHRAKVDILMEKKECIEGIVSYYGGVKVRHKRSFWIDENIRIKDHIYGNHQYACAFFHFHPEVNIEVVSYKKIIINSTFKMFFSNAIATNMEAYEYASGFNKRKISQKLIVKFRDHLITEIVGF